jgi:branched-subunit amino acid transport protein
MTMLIVIVLVGAGSFALRVLPLLLIDRISLSRGAEQTLTDAAAAAMTTLVVGLVLRLGDHPTLPAAARWVGLALGLIAAVARWSMVRIMAVGLLGAWLTALALHL